MSIPLEVQCPYCGQSRHTYDPEEAILEIDEPCGHLCTSMSWSTEHVVEDVYRHPSFAAAEESSVDLTDMILSDEFPADASTPRLTHEAESYFFGGDHVAWPELIDEEPVEWRYLSGIDPVPGSSESPRSMWLHVATLWSPDPTALAAELYRPSSAGA